MGVVLFSCEKENKFQCLKHPKYTAYETNCAVCIAYKIVLQTFEVWHKNTNLWSSCSRVFTNQIGFVQVADEKPTSASQI